MVGCVQWTIFKNLRRLVQGSSTLPKDPGVIHKAYAIKEEAEKALKEHND
jgi:hypothetical protein